MLKRAWVAVWAWLRKVLPNGLYVLLSIAVYGGLFLGACAIVITLAVFSGWLFGALAACIIGGLIGRESEKAFGRRVATVLFCLAAGLLPEVLFLAGFNMAVNQGDGEPLTMSALLLAYEKAVIIAHENLDAVVEPSLQWTALGAAVLLALTLALRRIEVALQAVRLLRALRLMAFALVAATSVTAFSGAESAGWSPNLRYRLEMRMREDTRYILEQNYAAALVVLARQEPATITDLADQVIAISKKECSQDHWMISAAETQVACASAITTSGVALREAHQRIRTRSLDYGASQYTQLKAQISAAVIDTRRQRYIAANVTEVASASVREAIGRQLLHFFGDIPLLDAFVQEFLDSVIHRNAERAAAEIPLAKLGEWRRFALDHQKANTALMTDFFHDIHLKAVQFVHPAPGQFLAAEAAVKDARAANQAMRYRFLAKSWKFLVQWTKKAAKFAVKEHMKP